MAKLILVSYNELNKVIKIPPCENCEVTYVRKECLKLFKFGSNVSVDLVFHKFDDEWDSWLDIDDDHTFKSKEKLKMVVQPILNDTVTSLHNSEVR